jgi:hypothetical protein
MLSFFLTLHIEQRVIRSVKFEQLRLSCLKHHQESVVVRRSLRLVKDADEINVTVQSKSVKDLVLLLLIVDSPYFEIPLDAKCDKHFGLWQVFDHLNSLTVDRESTVDVVQFLNMNQDETPFGHTEGQELLVRMWVRVRFNHRYLMQLFVHDFDVNSLDFFFRSGLNELHASHLLGKGSLLFHVFYFRGVLDCL